MCVRIWFLDFMYPWKREGETKSHFGQLIRIISTSRFLSLSSVKQLGSAVTIGFHVPMVSLVQGDDILVESAGGDV